MKNIIPIRKDIDTSNNNLSIVKDDLVWNDIHISANALVLVDDGFINVNEMPLHFYHILTEQYKENLTEYMLEDTIVFEHLEHCNQHKYIIDGKVEIKTGSTSWWNKDHFCKSTPPDASLLNSLSTFTHNGTEISSWGFKINIYSKELDGYFYKKDNLWFEKTNIGDDFKVK